MRAFFLLISFSFCCSEIFAQVKNEPAPEIFEWTPKDAGFNAEIKIFLPSEKKTSKRKLPVAYFVSFKNEPDSIYNIYKKMLRNFTDSVPCLTVEISFLDNSLKDSSDMSHAATYGTLICTDIKKGIEKKYADVISTNNIIISGLNDAALVTLAAAGSYKSSVAGTGLFFLNYDFPEPLVKENYFPSFSEGKIFMYVSGSEIQNKNTADLADGIALNSSLFVYKIDAKETDTDFNMFGELYSWMLADGNNYIIRID